MSSRNRNATQGTEKELPSIFQRFSVDSGGVMLVYPSGNPNARLWTCVRVGGVRGRGVRARVPASTSRVSARAHRR